MVQLNRGKRLVQGVQSSNIQVNVPSFDALENPIKVMGEIVTSNEKNAKLEYDRQVDTKKQQMKILQDEIASTQKATDELEADWIKQTEQKNDNALTASIIAIESQAYELSLKHHSDPALFSTEFNSYYNKLIETAKTSDWYDQTRALKLADRHSSILRQHHATINKNYLNKLNSDTWDGIEAVRNHSIINVQQLIANIENPSDLALYFTESNKVMQFLTDRIGSYETNVMGNSQNKKSHVDLQNVIAEYVYERDEAFLTHFLTNFVMKDVTPENTQIAQLLLDYYEQGRIPEKGDELDQMMLGFRSDPNYEEQWDVNSMEGLIEILQENTERYSGEILFSPQQREDIINSAQAAIERKVTEWNENQIKINLEKQSEINKGIEQANKELTNLSSTVYSTKDLRKIFQVYDKENNTWSADMEAVNDYELKQQEKQNFINIITERIQDTISDTEFLKKVQAIDFKQLGLEGKDPINLLNEYSVKLAFGDVELNVVSLTKDVFNEDVMRGNIDLMNGLNVMKQTSHMPIEFNQYFESAKKFDMKDEINQKHLVGMAIIKNYAFGTSTPNGMDSDISEALNEVYTAYDKGMGNFGQASAQWTLRLHPDHKTVSDNLKNWDTWYTSNQMETWTGGNISGYNHMESRVTDLFDKAVSREKWDDLLPWIALIDSMAWSGEWGGERDFDNMVKNKDTVGMVDWFRSAFGGADYTAQNLSLTASVVNMMEGYVDQNIHRFLHEENMKPSDFENALESVMQDGIRHMSNNPNVSFSNILYVPNSPNGTVVTDQDPKRLIMNGAYSESIIMQNANAFIGKTILKEFENNPNEASMMWFGVPSNSLDVNDWDDFKRSYMSLHENKKIKLKPVSNTLDTENPSWNIMIDPDGDGLWRVATKDGIPLEWFPNAQFTNSSKGFTYDETIEKWADLIIQNEGNISMSDIAEGWSDVYDFKDFGKDVSKGTAHWSDAFRIDMSDLANASDEDKQTFRTLLKKAISEDKNIFKNLLAGSKWFDESNIDTITEFQTLLTNGFDDFQKEIQKTMDFSFAKEQEVVLFNHNMRFYPDKFKNAESEEDMINISNQHNAEMTDLYNETFSIDNIGVIIPPNYAFVIKDIMASTDDWEKFVGEGSAFYSEVKNQNFRFAKNKLNRMKMYFTEIDKSDQFNSWLNLWNISYNK